MMPHRMHHFRSCRRVPLALAAAALAGLALFPAGVVAQATLPALTATPGPGGAQT